MRSLWAIAHGNVSAVESQQLTIQKAANVAVTRLPDNSTSYKLADFASIGDAGHEKDKMILKKAKELRHV